MDTFNDFKITRQLKNAIDDIGFEAPTPIQTAAFPVILSGKNIVGIAQTGTGKTMAYALPILQELKFSKEINPRVLILVPTRELVTQVVDEIERLAKYMTIRVVGVSGGVNINTQKVRVAADAGNILVATPRRLYDLVLAKAIRLNSVKKLVIDEVDVMLDLGFRYQLTNLFDLLPSRRQNIMFSATMTDKIDELINDFFIAPVSISVAVSGTPLDNIAQQSYRVPNYYTKVNLLIHLLENREKFAKVLIFAPSKRIADRLYVSLDERFGSEAGVIHANKSQNFRIRAVEAFDSGETRLLVSTDVMARGLDLERITHVVNFDTPNYPENYMHRIGRTGRAKEEGTSILFFTDEEEEAKVAIETLMDYEIPLLELPEEVEISKELAPEERPDSQDGPTVHVKLRDDRGPAFHEKKKENQKVNLGGGKRKKELKKKYKKPKTRGDKFANKRKKR